jgi:hypothetical protein
MLAFLNRADATERRALQRLFLYVGSMAVCESLLLKLEYISRPEMHFSSFYTIVVLGTLGLIVALRVASRHRWGCTILTAIYTVFGTAFCRSFRCSPPPRSWDRSTTPSPTSSPGNFRSWSSCRPR